MALILENKRIAGDIYRMRAGGLEKGAPGQFFMLHTAPAQPGFQSSDPLLPRPISILDAEGEETEFCYRVCGRGTAQLSSLQAGQRIDAFGPLGTPFPLEAAEGRRAVLVGGGIGIAPLLYLARTLHARGVYVEAFLGYSGPEHFLAEDFHECAGLVRVQEGGFITDRVEARPEDVYYACGPMAMMRALYERLTAGGAHRLYVSLERRMACGAGACLGCSMEMKSGMRRVCKDGPVFAASEVFYA